jgi:elongation factor 1-beta
VEEALLERDAPNFIVPNVNMLSSVVKHAEINLLNINAQNVDLRDRDIMGKVSLTLRVMPKEVNIDMNAFRDKVMNVIPDYAEIVGSQVKPIAFGLSALLIRVNIPDQSPEELIEKIKQASDVENVEVDDLTLI